MMQSAPTSDFWGHLDPQLTEKAREMNCVVGPEGLELSRPDSHLRGLWDT